MRKRMLIVICLLMAMILPSFVACNGSEKYLRFGYYPQTKVTDNAIIETLNGAAGTLPTADDSHAWTSYKYYNEGDNTTDYMWYIDLEQSGEKYRGVYFTEYRFRDTNSKKSDFESYAWDESQQDDNGYATSTVYWFKFEPIKWRVLEESNGESLILSERILDSQQFCHDPTDYLAFGYIDMVGRNAEDRTNNYARSEIRKWLNENFFNVAFSAEEKQRIVLSTVDNSARSTNPNYNANYQNNGVNKNACEDTEDFVFLLSVQEVTKKAYGFKKNPYALDKRRRKNGTDYSLSQGLYVSTKNKAISKKYVGNGYWILRSPDYGNYHDVFIAVDTGAINAIDVKTTQWGIVPALRIKKS